MVSASPSSRESSMPALFQSLDPSFSSSSSSSMKLRTTAHPPPRGISIFNSVFPFKFKYLGLSSRPRKAYTQIRKFSSGGATGRNPVLSHGRGTQRGEFQPGSFGGRVGQGKSLVEDEDELGDFSLGVGLSGKGGDDSAGVRVRDRDGDGFSSSLKKQRGSGYSEISLDNGRSSQNLAGSFPRIRKRSFERDSGDKEADFSPGQKREYRSRDGFSPPVKTGERDNDLNHRQVRRGKGLGRQAVQVLEDGVDNKDDDGEDGIYGFDKDVFKGAGLVPELDGEDAMAGAADSYLSQTRFDQCSVSSLSLKGIKAAGYERMTLVQEATLPIILKGKDVLAKAKTGTGKTVAFLLPAIEVIVKLPHTDHDRKRPPINVLVICPTRELASQAAAEANKLLKYHPSIGVQVVIGGTRLTLEQKRMQANPCQILVATPGRLKDHIENTPAFASRLMGVKILVLDEADHLLDMGFRKDIEKIIAAVPKQRQTLLFSATVPEEVRQISHIALKRDHEFVNTVEVGSEETHSQVRQMHLVSPLDEHFSLVYRILTEHIAEDADYKVLVFCTTAMVTRLVANLLSELNLNVREIHSRKPQSYRTRVSDEFRNSKGLILVTSDVSARGVDYPDVTLVIQVGLPSDREQYIHRLGRTGRKGKQGKGILLLAPWEEFFLASVKDLPIAKASSPPIGLDTRKKVEQALLRVEMKNKEAAYQAWLGYYNSNKKVGRDKTRLVELANDFSRSMGLDIPPAIPKLILGKMGLRNVPGLRIK